MGKIAAGRAVKVFREQAGFSVLTRISVELARERERLGLYRAEFDNCSGALLGYRLVGEDVRKVDTDLRSMRSDAAISAREMNLNCERSRTERCSEVRRRQMEADGFPPEDRIERVHAKVRVYVRIGPGKGDILRVWPRQI